MNSKSIYTISYRSDGYSFRRCDGRGKTRTWKFQPGSGSLDRTTFHLVFRGIQSAIRTKQTGDEFEQRASVVAALVRIGQQVGCTTECNPSRVVWRIDAHKLVRFEVFSPGAEAEAFRRLKRSGCVFRFFVNVQTGFLRSFYTKAGQEFDKVREEVAA
jgi:hypothetical protein